MDEDRKEGTKKQVKGSVKEAFGKVSGNEEREAEGTVEKETGKVQKNFGKAKDAARDALKDS